MPHRIRKIRKKRGSRTHGWGQVGQHRESGRRGGRGKTGMGKHKWTRTIKYAPDYFGKHGFKSPMGRTLRTMNVGKLDELIESLLMKKQAKREGDGVTVDLSELGVDKLLGSGRVTHSLVVRAKSVSQFAARKIREAGGQILKGE